VPCYHWYGHSEGALLGGWCEQTDKFHFFPQYGYLELVTERGDEIKAPDQIGELVGTGFCNSAMILIRYRTGDLGSGLRWEKCKCRRVFPTLEEIHGRSQDYIVASDGCKVPATALIFGLHLPIFNCYPKIQVEQFNAGAVTIRLQNPQHISHAREIDLSKAAMERALKGRISVSFEEVDAIPPRRNGKHQFLIQHLSSVVAEESCE
jgi:phenylacetate-CoA ligase